jgi:hypothetical protein
MMLVLFAGCGGASTEGNLPPAKPATQEEVKAAQADLDEQMKNMGAPAQ